MLSYYLLAKHVYNKEKAWDSVPTHSIRVGFYSSVKGRAGVRASWLSNYC